MEDHHARRGALLGQEQRVGEPVVLAGLRTVRAWSACFMSGASSRTRPRAVARLSDRLAPERGGPARGRRLRRDRAGARVRHAGVRVRGGRHPRPCPRLHGRLPGAHRALRGGLREQGVPLHRRLPAARRGGAVVRRGLGRRAAPGARRAASRRSGSTCTATTRPRPSSSTRSSAGVGHIVVDSFDEIDRLERLAPGQKVMLRVTPGIKPDTHANIQTGQEDSKFGFGLDDVPRAIERIEHARAGRAARAHRLAGLRPRAVREARRGARRDGRLSAAQPRRRPRHRLHGRPAAALGRRATWTPLLGERARGRDRALRARPLARRERRRDASTRWAPSSGSRACAPTWRWTAACPTTCGRCSTAPRYEAEIADRFGGDTVCTIAGHALRVGRHPGARRRPSTTRAWATCW